MGSKEPTEQELVPNIIKGISLYLLDFWIVFANALVFVVLYKNPRLRTVPNLLVANQALTDFILGLMVLPLSAMYAILSEWNLGKLMCELWLTCDILISTASIWNLSMIGLDRYKAITQPVEYLTKRTTRTAIIMISSVWIFSAAIAIVPFLGWKNFSESGNYGTSNNITHCFHFQDLPSFTIYSAVGSFIIPLLLMFYVYFRIYQAFANHKARQRYRQMMLKQHIETTILHDISHAAHPEIEDDDDDDESDESENEEAQPIECPPPKKRTPSLKEQRRSKSHTSLWPRRAAIKNHANDEKRFSIIQEIQNIDTEEIPENILIKTESYQQPTEEFSPSGSPKIFNTESSANSTFSLRHLRRRSDVNEKTPLTPRSKSCIRSRSERKITKINQTGIQQSDDIEPVIQKTSFFKKQRTIKKEKSERPRVSLRRKMQQKGENKIKQDEHVGLRQKFSINQNSVKKIPKVPNKPKAISAAKEKRGFKVLGIILGCFVVCWIPFFIMYMVMAFCRESCKVEPHVEQFITWLGYANSAMNPIIYTVFNRDYQIALRKLINGQGNIKSKTAYLPKA